MRVKMRFSPTIITPWGNVYDVEGELDAPAGIFWVTETRGIHLATRLPFLKVESEAKPVEPKTGRRKSVDVA